MLSSSIAGNYCIGATDHLQPHKTLEESPYIIKYSNHFEFNGSILSFRKKELFDITATPTYVPFKDGYWYVNRKQLTKAKAQELLKQEPIEVDVTHLPWYRQLELDHVFNLTYNERTKHDTH